MFLTRFKSLRLALLGQVLFLLGLTSPVKPDETPRQPEPAYHDNFYGVEIQGNLSWIVGYYGTILHSKDRGFTWELQASGTNEALFRVVFLDNRRGWISGSYGTILHTEDGGGNWRLQPTPTEQHLLGLHFESDRFGWAVGSRGTVLYTKDGGASWIERSIGKDVILNDVFFISRKQGWIVGEFGQIYQTKNGGHTWVKQNSPVEVSFTSGKSRNLFRLLFPDSAGGWAFGLDGMILRTRDDGRWEVVHGDGGSAEDIRYHLFAASIFKGKKWAVGERGILVSAPTEGNHWRRINLKIPPVSLNGVAFGNGGFGLIVGNWGTVLHTSHGGEQWRLINLTPETLGKAVSQFR